MFKVAILGGGSFVKDGKVGYRINDLDFGDRARALRKHLINKYPYAKPKLILTKMADLDSGILNTASVEADKDTILVRTDFSVGFNSISFELKDNHYKVRSSIPEKCWIENLNNKWFNDFDMVCRAIVNNLNPETVKLLWQS